MRRSERLYLLVQAAMSVAVMAVGVGMALRCVAEQSGDVYVMLFAALAYTGYKLMYRPTVAELRSGRRDDRRDDRGDDRK